jgi:hypothetical protein
MNSLAKWMDKVFGNNDGKLDWKDAPNSAPAIVMIVVDVLMLFAEYRVFSAGYELTQDTVLAIGFVAVSSVPFYMGQLAWLYNRANWQQQLLAILMIVMGLCVSAYFGFTDYLISTVSTVGLSVNYDPASLYEVAVLATVAIIVGGLLYAFFDDAIANNIKGSRMQARANVVAQEMDIKRMLLAKYKEIKEQEDVLRGKYGNEEVDVLSQQFKGKRVANEPATVPVLAVDVKQEALAETNPTKADR